MELLYYFIILIAKNIAVFYEMSIQYNLFSFGIVGIVGILVILEWNEHKIVRKYIRKKLRTAIFIKSIAWHFWMDSAMKRFADGQM